MDRNKFYIKRENHNLPLPSRATEKSAGIDLFADITEDITLQPFERKLIPTGIKVICPRNFHIEIRSRSGLAFKYGIFVLNSPGTVDEDYFDEVKVLLANLSLEPYTVKKQDRIAQMVLVPVSLIEPIEIGEKEFNQFFEKTNRNGGFGSTGI